MSIIQANRQGQINLQYRLNVIWKIDILIKARTHFRDDIQ